MATPWNAVFEHAARSATTRISSDASRELCTFSAEGVTVADFLGRMAADYGVSVVCAESIDEKKVSIHCTNLPVSDVLQAVARRCGVQVIRVGAVWFLGDVRAEDRAVLVRRFTRVDPTKASSLLAVYQSDSGRSAVTDDGVCVVGDRVEVLTRISTMLD